MPRAGEVVQLTAVGVPPGDYALHLGIPQTDFAGVNLGTVARAGLDGRLSGSVIMPVMGRETCYAVSASRVGGPPGEIALTMAIIAGNVLSPRACALLPRYPLPTDAVPITVSNGPPRSGEVVELTGTGLVGPGPVSSPLRAFFSVRFDSDANRIYNALPGSGEADALGNFHFSLTLPPNARVSGQCVALTLQRTDVGNPGYAYGYTEFDWP